MGDKPNYSPEFILEAKRHSKNCAKHAVRSYFFVKPYFEDIEAWCFLRYVEGRSFKTSYSRMVVDYLRKHFGDSRRKSHKRQVFEPSKIMPKHKYFDSLEAPVENAEKTLAETQISKHVFESLVMFLTKQEAFIIRCYYYEELKMHEIGALLSLSESRISQIHDTALNKLRSRFKNPLTEC